MCLVTDVPVYSVVQRNETISYQRHPSQMHDVIVSYLDALTLTDRQLEAPTENRLLHGSVIYHQNGQHIW